MRSLGHVKKIQDARKASLRVSSILSIAGLARTAMVIGHPCMVRVALNGSAMAPLRMPISM